METNYSKTPIAIVSKKYPIFIAPDEFREKYMGPLLNEKKALSYSDVSTLLVKLAEEHSIEWILLRNYAIENGADYSSIWVNSRSSDFFPSHLDPLKWRLITVSDNFKPDSERVLKFFPWNAPHHEAPLQDIPLQPKSDAAVAILYKSTDGKIYELWLVDPLVRQHYDMGLTQEQRTDQLLPFIKK